MMQEQRTTFPASALRALTVIAAAWLVHAALRAAAARIWNTREPPQSTGPKELAVLHQQWDRLAAIRKQPDPRYYPAHYIPNDGHPSATGNEFVAKRLAGALSSQ